MSEKMYGSLLYAGALSLATFGLAPFSIAHGGGSRPPRTWADGVKLDAAERRRVMDAVIENVKQYYFDPHVAQEVADALRAHEKRGEYGAVVEGGAFADLLTRQIRDVSHDMHLEVVYSEDPLSDRPREPTPEVLARYRKALEQDNCTFEKVKILRQNIGYLKLNAFPLMPLGGLCRIESRHM